MSLLTPSLETRITSDWADYFTNLGSYCPMHLLRRVGALLVGIVLERDSSGSCYRPIFHVHCLARTRQQITLTLAQPLRTVLTGAPESIAVRWHEAKFLEAAERLARQAPLSLAGDLSVGSVLAAYRAQLQSEDALRYQPSLYEDMALIYAWTSRVSEAQAIVHDALRNMQAWPAYVRQKLGDLDAWGNRLFAQCSNPGAVQTIVQDNIERFSLASLPQGDLRA